MGKDVYNKCKLAFHKDKVLALAKGEITAPVYARVKPTNKCNHHCFYCGYEEDKRRESMDRIAEIPFEKMMEILENFKEMEVKAVTYSGGGEPLIYPKIVEVLQKTLDYGIDLSIITNGQQLKGKNAEVLSKAKWVRISSDSADAKTFAVTRRVPEKLFGGLTENIKNFSRIKDPDCEFGINFVVQEHNADKVFDSVKHFKELGCNHIKITPCWMPNFLDYHKPFINSVLLQIQKAKQELTDKNFAVYDTYKADFEHCGVYERTADKCLFAQSVTVIGADCNVYFCHDKAYAPDGVLGSIKNKSFKELWFSEEAKNKLQNLNPKINCPHHCANDLKNMRCIDIVENLENLDKYKPDSERHKNFI